MDCLSLHFTMLRSDAAAQVYAIRHSLWKHFGLVHYSENRPKLNQLLAEITESIINASEVQERPEQSAQPPSDSPTPNYTHKKDSLKAEFTVLIILS